MSHATLTTLAVEEWRPIAGYEGLYEVSNLGRVRSLDRIQSRSSWRQREFMQHYKGRILKPQRNNKGYYTVMLQVHKKYDMRLVSRLVAEAFIPNPNNLPVVNHKDQVPTNNVASNLEWCTTQYNVTYANAVEMRVAKVSRPIEQLTIDGKHVAFYKSAKEAQRIGGYDHTNIGRVIHGKQKQYLGFLWRYASTDQ